MTYEEVMLEQLTFDLMIDNPYRHLFELLGQLELVHNKNLRQAAWAFCNDACLTALPLLIEARDVAITAIFFASAHTNQQIDDTNGEPWWRYLRGDESRCAKAIEIMRQFYAENPLRKQNPSLPSPAFHLEHTRRRGDTAQGHTDLLSTSNGSLGRGSRSPAARINGSGDGGSRDRTEPSSQAEPSQEGYTPQSPTKRKEPETAGGADGQPSEKRARLSSDEGELVE